MPTKEVSDKDVESSRKKVDDLREKVANEKAKLADSEASRNNAVAKARLDTEAESLEQELAILREAVKTSQKSDENLVANIEAAGEASTEEPVLVDPDADKEKGN